MEEPVYISGGFGRIPKEGVTVEHLERAFNEFRLIGSHGIQVAGGPHTGCAISGRPITGTDSGVGASGFPTPVPPPALPPDCPLVITLDGVTACPCLDNGAGASFLFGAEAEDLINQTFTLCATGTDIWKADLSAFPLDGSGRPSLPYDEFASVDCSGTAFPALLAVELQVELYPDHDTGGWYVTFRDSSNINVVFAYLGTTPPTGYGAIPFMVSNENITCDGTGLDRVFFTGGTASIDFAP